ncbi:helix-turn-helix domain-containing protein [Halorhodospira halophila]|uniref:helix-turn-helix domain-containing protein n=1 Tax=Halorhodospira halophila TaxID=1053 RepID=UPI00191444BB|nr:helix-turn-helix transcriptional regulator [Halorhodospira halophila]MBK5942727.1 hypothetical protein [Halorhodospira halophila]
MTPDGLKRWRRSLGLSQRAAAEALRVPTRTLQSWEAGERNPSGCLALACAAVSEGLEPWQQHETEEIDQ